VDLGCWSGEARLEELVSFWLGEEFVASPTTRDGLLSYGQVGDEVEWTASPR